jgi:hypothetical protein
MPISRWRHFYEHITEKHGVKVSYNGLRLMLQEAGVAAEGNLRAATICAGASGGQWSAYWYIWMPRPMRQKRP